MMPLLSLSAFLDTPKPVSLRQGGQQGVGTLMADFHNQDKAGAAGSGLLLWWASAVMLPRSLIPTARKFVAASPWLGESSE